MGAVFISSLMQIVVIMVPWLQRIFYTTALSYFDWFMIITMTLFSTIIGDLVFQFRGVIKKHLSIFHWETHRSTL